MIVPCTNQYATVNHIKDWKRLTPEGAVEYLMILLYFGVFQCPAGPAFYFKHRRQPNSPFHLPFMAQLKFITTLDIFRNVRKYARAPRSPVVAKALRGLCRCWHYSWTTKERRQPAFKRASGERVRDGAQPAAPVQEEISPDPEPDDDPTADEPRVSAARLRQSRRQLAAVMEQAVRHQRAPVPAQSLSEVRVADGGNLVAPDDSDASSDEGDVEEEGDGPESFVPDGAEEMDALLRRQSSKIRFSARVCLDRLC